MANNFRGWRTVFGFTFRQSAKGAGFKTVTAIVSILIIAVFIVINISVARPKENEKVRISPVKSVYVLDNSGLVPTNYKAVSKELSSAQFKNIEFFTVTKKSREETIQTAASDSSQSIAVIITAVDTGYEMEAVIPSNSTISEDDANELLQAMVSAFESNKMLQAGLSVQQLTTILKPVITSFSRIGESSNEIALVIKMIAPMLFGLMLYTMLLLYGQTISKSVSIEKTSKLIETLLISVHTYALIAGKILATTTLALLQFVTWIVSAVVGLYGGNAIAHRIYPEYENSAVTIINFLKDNIGETAFTLPAVILAIVIFCVGFLFYSVIAGLAGCMVSKPEDVSSTQAIFQFPVIISWLACYLTPLTGNEQLLGVLRYIPFTTPFCVPIDLITGTIGLLEGIITLVILSVFSLLVIMLSGRIYKALILYTGQRFSFKAIGNLLKANK